MHVTCSLTTGAVTHSEHIRTIINNAKRGPEAKAKKGTASKRPQQDEAPSISIEPLGQNRNRQRIWALDGRSFFVIMLDVLLIYGVQIRGDYTAPAIPSSDLAPWNLLLTPEMIILPTL